jgi:hypothetical protein
VVTQLPNDCFQKRAEPNGSALLEKVDGGPWPKKGFIIFERKKVVSTKERTTKTCYPLHEEKQEGTKCIPSILGLA